MDAKDKQMTELIMQVAAMKTGGRYAHDNDGKPQSAHNPKRKAEESKAGRGDGSSNGGALIKTRNGGSCTPHSKFGFPIEKNAPFITHEIKWDSTWLADKQAYYKARKTFQAKNTGKGAAKKEPIKAQKIAALKK